MTTLLATLNSFARGIPRYLVSDDESRKVRDICSAIDEDMGGGGSDWVGGIMRFDEMGSECGNVLVGAEVNLEMSGDIEFKM